MQNKRLKRQKYRICDNEGKHIGSDSKVGREYIVREDQEKKQSS